MSHMPDTINYPMLAIHRTAPHGTAENVVNFSLFSEIFEARTGHKTHKCHCSVKTLVVRGQLGQLSSENI